MAGLKKKRRIQIIIAAFAAMIVSFGLIYVATKDGVNFFYSPTQVVTEPPAADRTFRLGGLVEEGSIRNVGETVHFTITDGANAIPAVYSGILPDLFNEGQGAIGQGKLVDGVFVATEILARHDESYMPKEVIDALEAQGVYQDPNAN